MRALLLGKLASKIDFKDLKNQITTSFEKQVETDFDDILEKIIESEQDIQVADIWRSAQISKEKNNFEAKVNNPRAIRAEFGAGINQAPNGVVRTIMKDYSFGGKSRNLVKR